MSADCKYPLGSTLELQLLRCLVSLVPPGLEIPFFHHPAITLSPPAARRDTSSSSSIWDDTWDTELAGSSSSNFMGRLLPMRPLLSAETPRGLQMKCSAEATAAAAASGRNWALTAGIESIPGLPSYVPGLRDAADYVVSFWEQMRDAASAAAGQQQQQQQQRLRGCSCLFYPASETLAITPRDNRFCMRIGRWG